MRTKTLKINGQEKEAMLMAGGYGAKVYAVGADLVFTVGKKNFIIEESNPAYKITMKFVNLKYQPNSEHEYIKLSFQELVSGLSKQKNPREPEFLFGREGLNDWQHSYLGSDKDIYKIGQYRSGHAYTFLPHRIKYFIETHGTPDFIHVISNSKSRALKAVYAEKGKILYQLWSYVDIRQEPGWKLFEKEAHKLGYKIKHFNRGKSKESKGYWLEGPVSMRRRNPSEAQFHYFIKKHKSNNVIPAILSELKSSPKITTNLAKDIASKLNVSLSNVYQSIKLLSHGGFIESEEIRQNNKYAIRYQINEDGNHLYRMMKEYNKNIFKNPVSIKGPSMTSVKQIKLMLKEDGYFDLAEAIHCYLSLYHEGQGSFKYALLSRSLFRPGPLWKESRCEKENDFYPLVQELSDDEIEMFMDEIENQSSRKNPRQTYPIYAKGVPKLPKGFSGEWEQEDYLDAIDAYNRTANMFMEKGIEGAVYQKSVVIEPSKIIAKGMDKLLGKKGFLKSVSKAKWLEKLPNKIISNDKKRFQRIIGLWEDDNLPSVIVIDDVLYDGYHRVAMAHALGQKVVAAIFKTRK